jgi:hypothetical protein
MGRKATASQSRNKKTHFPGQKKVFKRRHQQRKALSEKLKDQTEETNRIYEVLQTSERHGTSKTSGEKDSVATRQNIDATRETHVDFTSQSIDSVTKYLQDL